MSRPFDLAILFVGVGLPFLIASLVIGLVWTTTSEVGKAISGKQEWQKDILGVAIAHSIPYAASATIADWRDYISKVRRAIEVEGPTFLYILAPCQLGLRFATSQMIQIARLEKNS